MTAQSVPRDQFLACHHCQRPLRTQISSCSARSRGHCPFTVVNPPSFAIRLAAAIAVLAIGALLIHTFWSQTIPVLFIVAFTGFIVLNLLYHAVQYDSPSTTVSWTQYFFMGFPCGHKIRVPRKEPGHTLPAPVRLADPASHVAYYHALEYNVRLKATYIVRAALAGLLSSGLLEPALHDEFSKTIGGAWVWQRRTLLTFTTFDGVPRGVLEQKMFEAIRTLSSNPLSAAMTPYDVVRATYDQDVPDPEKWVTDIMAREVAVGNTVIYKRFRPRTQRTTFEPAQHVRYASQINDLAALEEWMRATLPLGVVELDSQIERAIKSRKKQQPPPNGW